LVQHDLLLRYNWKLEDAESIMTVEALRRQVNGMLRILEHAPWKLDSPLVFPEAGPCTECVKRSSCHQELFPPSEFGDVHAKLVRADRCLDPVCFDRKKAFFVQIRQMEVKKEEKLKKQPLLVERGAGYDEIRTHPLANKITRAYSVEFVKKGTAGAEPAVVAAGQGVGETCYVKVKPNRYSGSSSPKAKKNEPPAVQLKREREQHERKVNQAISNEFALALRDLEPAAVVEKVGQEQAVRLIVSYFPYDSSMDEGWKKFKELAPRGMNELLVVGVKSLLLALAVELNVGSWSEPNLEEVDGLARVFGLSVRLAEIRAEVHAANPEPEHWAALEEKAEAKQEKPKKSEKKKAPAKKAKGKKDAAVAANC
jgi:hypothetical protein